MPTKATTLGLPVLLGIPFDAHSSYLRGPAEAPPLIREAFHCESSNLSSESGVDLSASAFIDAGDLELPQENAFQVIENSVTGLLAQGQRPVCLGGGHQRRQAARFGVEVIEMRNLPAFEKLDIGGNGYISFDVDVLDPAFAPGISHREPGGMSVREALSHLHAIRGNIVGADIVEYNPRQDIAQLTAMVCGKILKELLGKMLALQAE